MSARIANISEVKVLSGIKGLRISCDEAPAKLKHPIKANIILKRKSNSSKHQPIRALDKILNKSKPSVWNFSD